MTCKIKWKCWGGHQQLDTPPGMVSQKHIYQVKQCDSSIKHRLSTRCRPFFGQVRDHHQPIEELLSQNGRPEHIREKNNITNIQSEEQIKYKIITLKIYKTSKSKIER
ncbi:hypothetical protein NPIL_345141 [Nephila pilipes]|uniref:Uncharacterized protein n=1 Tax=Nephila pilipes TaxID=299642 RepID=A0A8X6NFE5_NEPPI|nr:hypothetical protein NPIL_345141 [Nephila pilipes]